MSEEIKLGSLIPNISEVQRDAIHVAIVPLIAECDLYSGEQFKLLYGTTNRAISAGDNGIGIVDPFITDYRFINKGSAFWGLLFPGTITGMRHHWEHPAFSTVAEISKSELWLRQFADRWGMDFNEIIEGAAKEGDHRYITARGQDLHSEEELGEDLNLFWEHLSKYTNLHFSEEHKRSTGWSCSC